MPAETIRIANGVIQLEQQDLMIPLMLNMYEVFDDHVRTFPVKREDPSQ